MKYDSLTGDPLPEPSSPAPSSLPLVPLEIPTDADYETLTDEQKVEALAKKASPEAVQKIYGIMMRGDDRTAMRAADTLLAYSIGRPVERRMVVVADQDRILARAKQVAMEMGLIIDG